MAVKAAVLWKVKSQIKKCLDSVKTGKARK